MTVKIHSVRSKKDLHQFIRLPYDLHQQTPQWVPPLLLTQEEMFSPANAFWQANQHSFFLAYQGERCAGRIAAFIDKRQNEFFGTRSGSFGFVEGVDDAEVFRVLLEAAEVFLRSHDCDEIIGPLNPTIHHELGILVAGFETPPYFMLTHNPPYYQKHISRCGYLKLRDFYAYKIEAHTYRDLPASPSPKVRVELRHPNMRRFEDELKILWAIYNNAFTGHWGFSPISWEDFYALAKDLKRIIDPELVHIAEKEGKAVGFILALPNLNEALIHVKNGRLLPLNWLTLLKRRRHIKSVRIITVAVIKEYQPLGLGQYLYQAVAKNIIKKGYLHAEISWVVEDNKVMNKIARRVGGYLYKTFRLYFKKLKP